VAKNRLKRYYVCRTGRHEVSNGARSERQWTAKHHLRLYRQRRHLVSTARIRRRMINISIYFSLDYLLVCQLFNDTARHDDKCLACTEIARTVLF